ncbi:hypothetical protein V495_05890 [Pseudogymnoascus sp. VKM F-4514 (FW-929)]|nr:hypothetical protein V495_05890 [Pseudogymnoascus sp. VKM F-4514 (FW-929)]KFY56080.1 hypothetical protein V497_06529 [Pseudogymnoascus sp. VKM F-4516 (FW-969)]
MPPQISLASFAACDECRARKFKCPKERPSCAVCSQQGKECIYSPRTERTPLTRQNLTAAEDRIRRLEEAFAELLPEANIDEILSSRGDGTPHALPQRNSAPVPTLGVAVSAGRATPRDSASPGAEETLPQKPDGFDWVEETTFSSISDGMAALSMNPEGTGYLGKYFQPSVKKSLVNIPDKGSTSSVIPLRALLVGDLSSSSLNQVPMNNSAELPSQFPGPTAPLAGYSESFFIDAYFRYYHTTYPFLHEQTFRAQYEGQSPRPRGETWPILLNTVLALGAWNVGDDNSTMDDTFYHEVNRHMRDTSVFEVGNLALVQALALLSNYTQKRNKPNTGWNYLGLAVRMALSLGLHKEFPGWKISDLQREMRRRVWWGVYIFDSGASITFGRPVLLPEISIMDANEHLTLTTTSLPNEIASPTIYSSLIVQSKLHQAINPVYHRLISTPPPGAHELLSLQKPIDDWEASIPPYFQLDNPDVHQHDALILARYRLTWRAANVRIILFRPIVLKWAARRWTAQDIPETEDPEEEQCRQLCLQSARETIASISRYMTTNIPSRLGSWYMLYFLFQAGLIPIIFLITTSTSPSAPSWLDDLRVTKDLLSYAAVTNRLADRCLEVINRFCAMLFDAEQPEAMLQDPSLFDDVHSMFVGEYGDGMDFLDWSNFGLQPDSLMPLPPGDTS